MWEVTVVSKATARTLSSGCGCSCVGAEGMQLVEEGQGLTDVYTQPNKITASLEESCLDDICVLIPCSMCFSPPPPLPRSEEITSPGHLPEVT